MLSLSEDIRILLKGLSGEGQPGDAASNVVLQQVTLVGFKQESLDAFPAQKEQLPVGQLDQLCSRWLVLLEIEHDVGKRLDGKVGGGDLLVDCPLKHAEVPKSREQVLGQMRLIVDSDQWPVVFPSSTHFANDRWKSCTLMSTRPSLLHGNKNFSHGIVKQLVCTSGVEIQQSFQSGSSETSLGRG